MEEKKKKLEEEIRLRENKIKQTLGTFEKGRLCNYVITWKPVIQRRLNTKRLKAEKPDLYDLYSIETEFRKFVIREVR